LRDPSFLNGTAPLVWFPFHLTNFGHVLRGRPAVELLVWRWSSVTGCVCCDAATAAAPRLHADNAARLWGAVQDTPWGGAIKLVPVTAEGQALPRMVQQLLQPISPLRVESWADFSARLVRGSQRGETMTRGGN